MFLLDVLFEILVYVLQALLNIPLTLLSNSVLGA